MLNFIIDPQQYYSSSYRFNEYEYGFGHIVVLPHSESQRCVYKIDDLNEFFSKL